MHILHLISSPRKDASDSIKLGNYLVDRLLAANPGSTVQVRDLTRPPLPPLEEVHMQSFFTPSDSRSPEQQQAVQHSDQAIDELLAADIIVVGAPLYNFTIPAVLKTWIDHIARVGRTFRYTATGPEGLVTGKKVYVAMASGAVYSKPPMQAFDFVVPYLQAILGFVGMTDVTVVRAEGSAVAGIKEAALPQAFAEVDRLPLAAPAA